ncbi:hypothetical protein HanIR_Chr08g0388091 [Helianthus annuus]|nr:hypothetical protein HanIR_Chr08g0388091 [Helianthus annuus]
MRTGHERPLGLSNARAETSVQGARRKPNSPGMVTWAFVPNPRSIPDILMKTLFSPNIQTLAKFLSETCNQTLTQTIISATLQ